MKYGKVVEGVLVEAPAGAGPSEGWLPVAKRPAPPGAAQAGWRVRSGWIVPAWRRKSVPELPEDPTNAEVVSTVRKLAAAAGCLLLSLTLPAATVQTAKNSELRQSSSVVTNVTFDGLLVRETDPNVGLTNGTLYVKGQTLSPPTAGYVDAAAEAVRRYSRACRNYKWDGRQGVLYRIDFIDGSGHLYMQPVTNVNALAEGNEHVLFYLEDHKDD